MPSRSELYRDRFARSVGKRLDHPHDGKSKAFPVLFEVVGEPSQIQVEYSGVWVRLQCTGDPLKGKRPCPFDQDVPALQAVECALFKSSSVESKCIYGSRGDAGDAFRKLRANSNPMVDLMLAQGVLEPFDLLWVLAVKGHQSERTTAFLRSPLRRSSASKAVDSPSRSWFQVSLIMVPPPVPVKCSRRMPSG